MDARRWALIESLHEAALSKEPGERSLYLAQACREHPELQAEIESLLRCADEELNSPLEDGSTLRALLGDVAFGPAPASGAAGAVILGNGARLGVYEILAPIGAGGMGYQVYVQTFPNPAGKWQVSVDGGGKPVWSRDGKELYFIGADRKMMAVEVKGGDQFEAGVPKPLFDTQISPTDQVAYFDVSKDGRFLIPTPAEPFVNAAMTVVVNWAAGLKK